MKKWLDKLLLGYIIETAIMIFVVIVAFIWQFYDSFYNRFFFEWAVGRSLPWAGFALSALVALLLGFIAQTNRGWELISGFLNKIPLMGFVVNIVDQWKLFWEHAKKYGVILAPYFRKDSTFWPGVVTNLLPKDEGGYLITVTFGKITGPEPSLLLEEEAIYLYLTPSEAIAYMFSGGLALKMVGRKLKRVTLGEYIRANPRLIEDIMKKDDKKRT